NWRKCARHTRSGRRPKRCDRRDSSLVRLARGKSYRQSRRNISRSNDRNGGGRETSKDSKRNRIEYSSGRNDDYLSRRNGNASSFLHLQRKFSGFRNAGDGDSLGGLIGLLDSNNDWR